MSTEAMEGCKFVIHTASPFKMDASDVQRELIEPAVKGTESVLRAAAKAGRKNSETVEKWIEMDKNG